MNKKRSDLDKFNETAVKTVRILEVLNYEPITIHKLIKRIGFIPNVKIQLKPDSTNRILTSLKILGYVQTENGLWMRTHKTV